MHPNLILHASTVQHLAIEFWSKQMTKFFTIAFALALFAPVALAIMSQAAQIVA